ncbi:dipeptide/oligopeptide/nickel ABC transporter ATP-binding protein [Paenibacillus sp. S25]|uniref:ABC transporter ATP-binding protein n=1 Tax=Paenibacillus sp. S25 TaxID=2823905 RepID=UPI001C64AD30|nr:dipeptide/oligopeptide/nickel ABC transporter ATP-binding protein [Paenibacillus sp. S25]QYK62284.1 Oligopeptide transport ATP-binding protein OppF [Paenibacillus sp. S25]
MNNQAAYAQQQDTSNAVVTVSGLTKAYAGGKTVLQDVALSISPRECLGIVGESGSGKSTLARCILTLDPFDQGELRLDGQSIRGLKRSELKRIRSRLGAVFQHPSAALNPRLTILQSLLEPLDQLKCYVPSFMAGMSSERRDIAEHLLGMVKLPASYLDKFPHQLSGGEKQRVTIARAISTEPDFIVLDEPTASLDVTTQATVLNLLKDLQDELGLAYLFISHDLAAVHFMSDRIMVMKEGSVLEHFPKEALFHSERHPYTQSLLEVFSTCCLPTEPILL